MKHLKLLTHQAPAVHSGRSGVIKNRISSEYLHHFVKEDADKNYKHSETFYESDQHGVETRDRVTIFVVLMLIGTMALSYQWLTFTSLAIVIFCVSTLVVLFKRYSLSAIYNKTQAYHSKQRTDRDIKSF